VTLRVKGKVQARQHRSRRAKKVPGDLGGTVSWQRQAALGPAHAEGCQSE
jgi:hypothetical protein